MRVLQAFVLTSFLVACVSAVPYQSGRGSNVPSRQEAREILAHHQGLEEEEEDEDETLDPQIEAENDYYNAFNIDMDLAKFHLLNPQTGERTRIDFSNPITHHSQSPYVVDPRIDNRDAYIARRRAAEQAHLNRAYNGDYIFDFRNDKTTHHALANIAGEGDQTLGKGALYDVDSGMLYLSQYKCSTEALEDFDRGLTPIFYKDSRGRAHFYTRHEEQHPGVSYRRPNEPSDPIQESRRVPPRNH